MKQRNFSLFRNINTSNLSNQNYNYNKTAEKKEKEKKPKITYEIVKTGDNTCDLLTLVNGKIVKSNTISLQEAFEKYKNGSAKIDLKILFDFNQEIKNSMESKSADEAKRMYGHQVANNIFFKA